MAQKWIGIWFAERVCMTKRVLVTTALEETWPKNKPILFLGEWCRRYSRKAHWENLDAEVLPYHWDDRRKLGEDYLYLMDLYERLLETLSEQLNQIHHTQHSLRYWRILIGPWLGYFIQILFDRWSSIQQAVVYSKLSETVHFSYEIGDFIPKDMNAFSQLFTNDEWNHFIYSEIIKESTFLSRTILSKKCFYRASENQIKITLKRRVKNIIYSAYSVLSGKIVFDRSPFLYKTYLPLLDEWKLQAKLGQLPRYSRAASVCSILIDFNQRQWLVNGEDKSTFETFVRKMIPIQIPRVYLEGYRQLNEQCDTLSWPATPKFIWTSNAHFSDDVFKAWTAKKVDEGAPFVIGQHGGFYGVSQFSFAESHEMASCDYYLSWGWNQLSQCKIMPIGQIKSREPLQIAHEVQPHALMVTLCTSRYSFWLGSCIVSSQWLNYFKEQCVFVEKLRPDIRDALIVRLHSSDYNWDQKMRWRDRFESLTLDDGVCNIDELLCKSKLYISTYNATTYLESLSMNIPTVIFWNPGYYELRDSAIPYFEELKKVGIFHETPESAADHVGEIWDNVADWWYSEPVRQVLARFKIRYCHLPKDLIGNLKVALNSVHCEKNK